MTMNKTPAMVLQELTIKRGASPPVYNLIHTKQGSHENEFLYEVDVLGISARAMARSKKESRQEAARRALVELAEKGIFQPSEERSVNINATNQEDELKQVLNYKGILCDICLQYNIPSASYIEISAVGPPHAREFTYECHLVSLTTRNTASTKKIAQQNTAKEMLSRIKDILPQLIEENELTQNALCDKDMEAIDMYDELTLLKKVNLGIKICNYENVLRDRMAEKNLIIDDFKTYFEEPKTELKLSTILEMMELNYSFQTIQKEPSTTVVLNVSADVPLCSIAQCNNIEEAKNVALLRMFEFIEVLVS